MDAVPKRAKACEEILKNKPLSINTFDQAKKYLEKDLSPIGDMRASKEYRLEIDRSPKSAAFPVVAIVVNSITSVAFGTLPPVTIPLVAFDPPDVKSFAAVASPKSEKLPVVMIVVN